MDSSCVLKFVLEIILLTAVASTLNTSLDTSCSTLTTCSDSQSHKPTCKCDSQCWKRQDCCFNVSVTTGVRSIDEDYRCHVFPTNFKSQNVIGKQPDLVNNGYFLISRCGRRLAGNFDHQRALCEHPENQNDHLLKIPVSSVSTNESYRNIYCAACHDDVDNYFFWDVSTTCLATSNASSVDDAVRVMNRNDSACELQFTPPKSVHVFACKSVVNNSCPDEYLNWSSEERHELDWLCRVSHLPVEIRSKVYPSPYCAACHFNDSHIRSVVDDEHGTCVKRKTSQSRFPFLNTKPETKSFAILLDVDFSSTGGNFVGFRERCHHGYIFDVFTGNCRFVFCGKSYLYQDEMCRKQFASTESSVNYASSLTVEDEPSTSFKSCPKIRLEPHEGLINENGSLTFRQVLYPKGKFEQAGTGIYVCVEWSENYAVGFSSQIHFYLTVLCCSVSLLALLLKMVAYVLIAEIRNFPAKMVFLLSASLFLAQLLFLISFGLAQVYPLCATVAVLTHFFYLSSFCWTNVLAYDLWRTFSTCTTESRALSSSSGSGGGRLRWYSAYAWGAPCVIVSIACVLDLSQLLDEQSMFRAHYGRAACWISTKTALLLYFACPLALILLSNIFFFGITTINICVNSKATSLAQAKVNSKQKSAPFCGGESKMSLSKSPHHLRLSLYIKLALIMGLTWIIGFVAAYLDLPMLWYVFIFLNASQGVYILLAFTPYRKVQRFLERQLKAKRTKYSGRHPFFGRGGAFDQSVSSHRMLHRSSTRSSQTTTVSVNYSSHSHPKAAVVVSNSG